MVMGVAVKDEWSGLGGVALCCRRAEVAALLRFFQALFITAGRVVVSAEVDSGSVARRPRPDKPDGASGERGAVHEHELSGYQACSVVRCLSGLGGRRRVSAAAGRPR